MKKSLIYTTIAAFTLLISGGLTLAISNTSSANTNDDLKNLVAVEITNNDLVTNPLKQLSSKDESVYIITNNNGTANKTFIGSNLYTENEPLPITMNITYYLNGSEISATDLAGKSGHIKIVYRYTASATYQDKLVPFLAATGLQLDGTKFSNIKLNNGKIISEKDNYTVIGYSFAGLNENLGTNLLPSEFTLEADATNFELGNTYTFTTNSLIAELDLSKLNSVDEIINSINQLSNGFDQILAGASALDNGIGQLATGIAQLQSGVNELNTGAHQLADGASQLSAGLNQVVATNNLVMSYVNPVTDEIDADIVIIKAKIAEIAKVNPELAAKLAQIFGEITGYYDTAHKAVHEYVGGIEQLSSGASQLSSGLDQLATGADQLKSGVDQLATGTSQLSAGSHTLYSGLKTFKAAGIDQLTNFANNNLANFTANLRASVSAAKSYHSYGHTDAKTVKFIFKTPSIK